MFNVARVVSEVGSISLALVALAWIHQPVRDLLRRWLDVPSRTPGADLRRVAALGFALLALAPIVRGVTGPWRFGTIPTYEEASPYLPPTDASVAQLVRDYNVDYEMGRAVAVFEGVDPTALPPGSVTDPSEWYTVQFCASSGQSQYWFANPYTLEVYSGPLSVFADCAP